MYNTLTLPSGLRIVTTRYPNSRVEYFGIIIGAGSAMETPSQYGLAHFVEHCIFKGTISHSSNYILNHIEKIGGELNAYTNKEETAIFSISPFGYINRSLSLIADIVTNSVFPDNELDKERLVIAEEIDSYLDSPAESIFDEFDERLFAGTPYAHNILGTKDSIASFNSEECRQWMSNRFTPENSVIFYSGPLEHSKICGLVSKYFEKYNRTTAIESKPKSLSHSNKFNETIELPFCHQCHVALGTTIPGYNDPLRYALVLASNILGGPSLNSVLNLNLRERKGLVYTIEANNVFYSDTGEMVIYFGCDKNDQSKCIDIIFKNIEKLYHNVLSPRAFMTAKQQYLGQLAISLENREQSIMGAARSFLARNKVIDYNEVSEHIKSLRIDSLKEALEQFLPSRLSQLTIK